MRREAANSAYLMDMLLAARGVVRATQGMQFDDFLASEDHRHSIERKIEILGEAARRITTSFREAHPEIPWAAIISQRNVLAHEYDDIDQHLIWLVATKHIPQLIANLEALIQPLPGSAE